METTNLSFESILQMNDISKSTQEHISKVYSILAQGCVFSLATFYASSLGYVPVGLAYFALIVSLVLEIYSIFTRHTKTTKEIISPISFYLTAFSMGASIGSSLSLIGSGEAVLLKNILLNSFIFASALFVSTSIFAFLTVRRIMIYAGCAMTALVLSLLSIFFFTGGFRAVIGIIVGLLYLVIDTQRMVHKAENGLYEPYNDARHLFVDLVKLTLEISKLLMSQEKEKNKNKK